MTLLQELRQGKRVSVFATNPVRKAIIRSIVCWSKFIQLNYLLCTRAAEGISQKLGFMAKKSLGKEPKIEENRKNID